MESELRRVKIMSWNINGIRTSKECVKELLNSFGCDILCLQETKLTRDQLDEETAILKGFNSYYSFSRVKGGYSGVATICRDDITPIAAEEGFSGVIHSMCANEKDIIANYGDILENFSKEELLSLDSEGRSLLTKHKIKTHDGKEMFITIINVYCPHAHCENEERRKYKSRFFELLEQRACSLLCDNSHVIILGDLNAIYKEIDAPQPIENTKARDWLNNLLTDIPLKSSQTTQNSSKKFIDSFRHFHPTRTEAFTCWSTARSARTLNYGTRLDYILPDIDLIKLFLSSDIHPHIEGSDHCPVAAELNCVPIASKTIPFLCTKNWPEFAGKQQKLNSFFQKVEKHKRVDNNVPPASKKLKANNQMTLVNFFKRTEPRENEIKSTEEDKRPNEKATEIECKSSQENSQESSSQEEMKRTSAADKWKDVFKKKDPTPLCSGHKEPCVLRTVKKSGPNYGRQFYVCAHPDGPKTNPLARCDYFRWK